MARPIGRAICATMVPMSKLPIGHHTGIIIVRPNEDTPLHGDTDWVCLVSNADVTEDGVSVWCGLFRECYAAHVEVGTTIKNFIIYDRPENKRCEITVTKVNRVTIKFRAEDTGKTHTLRIDR